MSDWPQIAVYTKWGLPCSALVETESKCGDRKSQKTQWARVSQFHVKRGEHLGDCIVALPVLSDTRAITSRARIRHFIHDIVLFIRLKDVRRRDCKRHLMKMKKIACIIFVGGSRTVEDIYVGWISYSSPNSYPLRRELSFLCRAVGHTTQVKQPRMISDGPSKKASHPCGRNIE